MTCKLETLLPLLLESRWLQFGLAEVAAMTLLVFDALLVSTACVTIQLHRQSLLKYILFMCIRVHGVVKHLIEGTRGIKEKFQ